MEHNALDGPLIERLFVWGGGGAALGTIIGGVLGETVHGSAGIAPQRWAFRGGIYVGLLGALIVLMSRVHL
jgi:hypothetical protein